MATFNARQLFNAAEELERRGEVFYRFAADCTTDAALRDTLNSLADWEVSHRELFEQFRETVGDAPIDPEDEDLALYIDAVVRDRVFPAHVDRFLDDLTHRSQAEILTYAMDREKDTIVFYLTLETCLDLDDKGVHERIRTIVSEELSHVHLLQAALGNLSD